MQKDDNQTKKKKKKILRALRRYQPPYSGVCSKANDRSTSSSSITSRPARCDTKEATNRLPRGQREEQETSRYERLDFFSSSRLGLMAIVGIQSQTLPIE